MKQFTNKTVEAALEDAAIDLGVDIKSLAYKVVEEKSGLFSKKATIEVYGMDDAVDYAEDYLQKTIAALGIEISTSATVEDDIIRLSIDSERNPVLIGKGGRTLQALNELVRLAVSNKFHHRFRILLDVGGYKEDKYDRIERIARRVARDVVRDRMDSKLEAMTPDERRIVHNCLNGMEHIATESEGEGNERAVVIKYVD